MEVFLVGGAVRDAYLGLPIAEYDYVVVGAKPEDLTALGYKPVGQFFPVFLHPDTHAEYALARLERKTAAGHQGFEFVFSPEVTLEEDLIRRDLTINAMACSADGVLIDPYHGLRDLNNKILRHVSPAFAEDPLRVFRVARFYARFKHLGFSIHPDTLVLMQQMAHELVALSAERVWGELQKAIITKNPGEFFVALRQTQCLQPWFPYLAQLNDHDFAARLLQLAQLNDRLQDFNARAAYLLYCIGEREHSALKIPNRVLELCIALEKYCVFVDARPELNADLIMDLFDKLDAIRQPQRFLQVVQIVEFIPGLLRRRNSMSQDDWQKLLDAVIAVSAQDFVAQGLSGPAIGQALRAKRIEVIMSDFAIQLSQ